MARVKIPYFKWRDGRPRWEPGPGLRERGHAGRDLKDGAGGWLSKVEAQAEALRINAAIGGLPSSSKAVGQAAINSKTWANLIALYRKSPNYLRCKISTKRNYDNQMDLIEDWAGDTLVATTTRANIANWHMMLEETRGATMANRVKSMVSILLYYALDDLEWISKVRSRKIRNAQTEGRLVLWSMDEIAAFVATAERLERPDIADAVLLGCMTGQRRADILDLRRGEFAGGLYVLKTGKTSSLAKVPAIRQLRERVETMRARAAAKWPKVEHLTELVDVTSGRAFDPSGRKFHKDFRAVLLIAAGLPHVLAAITGSAMPNEPCCPSLLGRMFLDLRDTAVTWLFMAGCSIAEIATVTGHSLATVTAILDKHYFVRDDALAHSSGVKLEAFLDRQRFG